MDRREAIKALTGAALTPIAPCASAAAGEREVRLHVDPDHTLATIPAGFVGLGYEVSSVAQKGLLSPNNAALIRFVRNLGPAGVIRIGGNTSDLTAPWSATAQAVSAPKLSAVNGAAINDLAGFLRATGWKLIWGLNLGTGTLGSAVEEAAFVAAAVRDSLLAFEIGNEPDLFSRNGLRSPAYGYAEFYGEFKRYRDAIRKRVRNAPFAGPDAATKTGWVSSFARDEGSKTRLLTHHYYAGGPPTSPSMTIENLLKTDAWFVHMIDEMRSASELAGVPYRLVELNSCFGGGKPGVSDTFASALWGLDLMFTLASAGGGGLNIETGVNQLGFVSSYSPIFDDGKGNYSARPLYYAMLAFALSGRGRLVRVDYEGSGVNLKGYATVNRRGQLWLPLINRDLTKDVVVRLRVPRAVSSGKVIRLVAPSAGGKGGVMFGSATVGRDGHWSAKNREKLSPERGDFVTKIPAASAAVVDFRK
jgi:hypothetical protein